MLHPRSYLSIFYSSTIVDTSCTNTNFGSEKKMLTIQIKSDVNQQSVLRWDQLVSSHSLFRIRWQRAKVEWATCYCHKGIGHVWCRSSRGPILVNFLQLYIHFKMRMKSAHVRWQWRTAADLNRWKSRRHIHFQFSALVKTWMNQP